MEKLQNLNEEQHSDFKQILANLKGKYEKVNNLVDSTKQQFEKLKEKEKGLDNMEVGDERNKLNEEIQTMKNELKNTKGEFQI